MMILCNHVILFSWAFAVLSNDTVCLLIQAYGVFRVSNYSADSHEVEGIASISHQKYPPHRFSAAMYSHISLIEKNHF